MHPASYGEWSALVERYRRAVKAYSEAVQILDKVPDTEYRAAHERVEEAHRLCEDLRSALQVLQKQKASKTA